LSAFSVITSRVIPLPRNDIDTDQIIPARFLKGTDKEGFGEHLFADWRRDPEGEPLPEFELNQARYQGSQVLLAGVNFGCGSSREQAPWALVAWGIRAVVALSFADIFRANALKNGLLPVEVTPEVHRELVTQAQGDEGLTLSIDLEARQLTLPDGRRIAFAVEAFSHRCLVEGIDELGYLLKHEEQIAAFEGRRTTQAGV